MRLKSAKQCRHCVCGAFMGACARHLSHISQHRRFGTYRNVIWQRFFFFFFFFFFSPQLILQKSNGQFQRNLSFFKVPEGSNIFQGSPTFSQGGSNCLFPIETHITCDFPGGVRTPCPPSGSAHVSFHLLRMRASKALASPFIRAYSPEPALLTNLRHQMQV